MKLADLVNFFKSPSDREVIRRWTRPADAHGYAMELPQPADPQRFTFLALGDTGDSAALGARISPQDAVATELAKDTALPDSPGDGLFVLHTGDVVYMTGERRLYDRNFRRPYAAFLTPESTVDELVFRVPFLPVPGNHDYYDFGGWGATLARIPVLGAGAAALARQFFSFQIPTGGSDQGAAYMDAFVAKTETGAEPPAALPRYEPGVRTRIPNRYYRFRVGSVDFFALDSNTLDSPPPHADLEVERKEATLRVQMLEKQINALLRQIRRDEKAVDRWLETERRKTATDESRIQTLRQANREVAAALGLLEAALQPVVRLLPAHADVLSATSRLLQQWEAGREKVRSSQASNERQADRDAERAASGLEMLDAALDEACRVLEQLEHCFVELPEGLERSALRAAQEEVVRTTNAWRERGTGRPPAELCAHIQKLSLTALEVQRQLALERRRANRQPDDYDKAQLEWLRDSIAQSVRDNPDGWRVVFLHQPLYTTIGDHSENADVVGVRENLIPLMREHVHLVLAGHAHAFEWFRSRELPTTSLIVTGGGGQPWLWRSILDPRRFRRFRHLYRSLQESGVTECMAAGNGPTAKDGEDGPLYHYVRVEVTPEALRVLPVGVRRVNGGYRREAPMPVHYVPEFPEEEPGMRLRRQTRILSAIEVRRGERPRPVWG